MVQLLRNSIFSDGTTGPFQPDLTKVYDMGIPVATYAPEERLRRYGLGEVLIISMFQERLELTRNEPDAYWDLLLRMSSTPVYNMYSELREYRLRRGEYRIDPGIRGHIHEAVLAAVLRSRPRILSLSSSFHDISRGVDFWAHCDDERVKVDVVSGFSRKKIEHHGKRKVAPLVLPNNTEFRWGQFVQDILLYPKLGTPNYIIDSIVKNPGIVPSPLLSSRHFCERKLWESIVSESKRQLPYLKSPTKETLVRVLDAIEETLKLRRTQSSTQAR